IHHRRLVKPSPASKRLRWFSMNRPPSSVKRLLINRFPLPIPDYPPIPSRTRSRRPPQFHLNEAPHCPLADRALEAPAWIVWGERRLRRRGRRAPLVIVLACSG